MNSYFYDLHIHSCLSPCADNDMTPNNIAGMAALNGLKIAALTDHNTCGNCKSFFAACKRNGIIPIAGMELTTAEDIHLICLFETLDSALCFDSEVRRHYLNIKNRTDLFGEQLLLDEDDNIIGKEEILLSAATDLDIGSAVDLVRSHGGVVYPAHVDREANGIISMLGDIPPEYKFSAVEFNDPANIESYLSKYTIMKNCKIVCSSDAHFLWDINDAAHYFTLNAEPYSDELVRHNLLFNILYSQTT